MVTAGIVRVAGGATLAAAKLAGAGSANPFAPATSNV